MTVFAENAARLAGFSGAILGWRPDEFWNATPAELSQIMTALSPDTDVAADAAVLSKLQDLFPDG